MTAPATAHTMSNKLVSNMICPTIVKGNRAWSMRKAEKKYNSMHTINVKNRSETPNV
jgi:hypothetical protein